ncbi:hypothetical protein O0L34_g19257 [Tuta absoluta]|nr:hypothetical protein O0L34_g19257 [Tuta absoluta]
MQGEAIRKGVLQIIEECPAALAAVNKVLADRSTEFRQISDHLLQFTCGKRAEAIELRRKVLASISENLGPLLHKIPPSENCLFDEEKLQELSKALTSSFNAFRKKHHRDKSAPPIKRAKPLKKSKKELKVSQNRSLDRSPKASSSKKKDQKDRRYRTGRHF